MNISAKLSQKAVDNAAPKSQRYIVWDTDIPSFGVRVEPSGSRSYLIRYRVKGSPQKQLSLGKHPVVTYGEARKRAYEVLSATSSGVDPAKAREERKAGSVTFTEISDQFLDTFVKDRRSDRTLEGYSTIIKKHLQPAIGKKAAIEVTSLDAQKLHGELFDKPYQANRCLAVLSSVYSWAYKTKRITKKLNPTEDVERYKEEHRERFLTSEELARLGKALNTSAIDPFAKIAILLLLLTGCRLREILYLRWQDVDLERGFINLPRGKTGKRAVFLSPAAQRRLASLAREGVYVIPGKDPENPRPDLKRPWAALRKAAGLPDVRLHDLRHTNASIGVNSGIGLPIIGKLLGHTQSRTTEKYAHIADRPTIQAANAIGVVIEAALEGKLSDKAKPKLKEA
jgi:integrase